MPEAITNAPNGAQWLILCMARRSHPPRKEGASQSHTQSHYCISAFSCMTDEFLCQQCWDREGRALEEHNLRLFWQGMERLDLERIPCTVQNTETARRPCGTCFAMRMADRERSTSSWLELTRSSSCLTSKGRLADALRRHSAGLKSVHHVVSYASRAGPSVTSCPLTDGRMPKTYGAKPVMILSTIYRRLAYFPMPSPE